MLARYLDRVALTDAHYYLADPPGMVRSGECLLAEVAIAPDRILTDSFTGYE